MLEFFQKLFSGDFMPHGHCYLWEPGMVWLQVISNGLIGLSYIAISTTLVYLVYRIRNIPFQWIYLAFGLFIVTCGITHFMDIVTVWQPMYWLDGGLRAITAIASVGTAIILPPLIPKAIALAQGAKAAYDKGIRLETAYQELGQVFEKTKELDELKTQFFANVSHELRTPLALILGPTDRMKHAENLSAHQRRDLEVVSRNARVLLKHVNDLLDVAKLEAGKIKPTYVQTDLVKLIRVMAGNFDGLARERGITFTLEVSETFFCQVDRNMIERVFLNLLSNAFKFVPDHGEIKIIVKQNNSTAIISVMDNGPGIPPHLREAIFERFRQVEGSATRSHGGTGLGLSIVKEFIELHRGKISVSMSPKGGAHFQVELPIHAPAGEDVFTNASSENIEQEIEGTLANLKDSTDRIETLFPQINLKKGTVLVVEDNSDMNRFITEVLSVDYTIETALNGKLGLEKTQALRPDVIVSDIMMPEMSGDQMVQEIRKKPELSGIPIILLTAKADDDLRNRLLRESVQDYVVKPFSEEELLARVKNQVSMKRARDALQSELSSQLKDLEALALEITHRKKELQQTVEDLKSAKEMAERASQAKSRFLGMVSHELKTPMTSVKLQLEILRRMEAKNLSEKQLELLSRLDRSSERSIALMNTLFDYTKLQSGKIIPKPELIDVKELLEELIDVVSPDAVEKKLQLSLRFSDESMPELQSDRFLVQMVVRNLLSNAIKYTDTGKVEVTVTYQNSQHRISVKDSGPGIPNEQREIIFQPFEQLTPLKKKSKPGFGLGLSIASESIKAIGGEIQVSSEIGKGSVFVANFPRI